MANNNEKISIDIEINASGQQQLDQYKAAFDGLRTSINNLSDPIAKLDGSVSKLTDSVNKMGSENESSTDIITKLIDSFFKAKDISTALNTAFGALKIGVVSLEGALTGGLTVLIAFAPQLVNLIASLFKGKEAFDKAKYSLDALNKGLSSTDYSNAIQNVTQLKIKVDLAKKGMAEKEAVVKEYNKTIGQTVGQVRTLDQVETALKNNSSKYIEAMLHKATAMEAIKQAAENEIKAAKERNRPDEDFIDYMDSGISKQSKLYQEIVAQKRQAAMQPFTKASDAFKLIAKNEFEAEAKSEADFPINTLKKRIADLQKQTASGIVGSKAFKDLQQLKKELKELDPSTAEELVPAVRVRVKHSSPVAETPEANTNNIKEAAAKKLQDTAEAFNKQLEQQHNNYAVEQAALKDQLDKKLISQEEYFASWEKLQEKYHVGISESIKLFNEHELAQAQQHQRDLVEAEQLSNDQDSIDKAQTPADKLAAEKRLVNDKYNFEIQRAADAGKSTTEIRKKAQQEISALDKKYDDERKALDKKNAQDRKNFEVEQAQQISNAAFSILQNNIKSHSDAKIKELETQKNAELSNTSLTASQKKSIEDKYHKKEAEEKVKAFKAEQRASILQAVINGALAVTKATAQAGILGAFVIPGIIASTAIQVATIAAQKPPQYAKGGLHYQSDGRGALLSGYSRTDNTNAYLRSGEAVVVSEAMRNPWARNLVSAINVAYGGRDFSMSNPGHGYAIGGIFTDGGNSNRYYNQPVNDQKDLANTIAYQMINNFPPVYVDVKDINSQQNILAQTINRVNL